MQYAGNSIAQDATLDEIRAFFMTDNFATKACGCSIVEASRGHAVTEFTIGSEHQNVGGSVMGGAIFTLADFALAVASNVGENPSVSVSNSIEYINVARGTKLIATCDMDKSGMTLGYYSVVVHDDLGTLVARMQATCYRRAHAR